MDSEDAAARDLDLAIQRAAKFGITPSWSSRAYLIGWFCGSAFGATIGFFISFASQFIGFCK